MTLAVIGSRTFANRKGLFQMIDGLEPDAIVSGGAEGADKLAEEYAADRKIPITVIHPDWKRYGKSAGYRRNHDIIKMAEMVVAGWDRESRGTRHALGIAKGIGLTCF